MDTTAGLATTTGLVTEVTHPLVQHKLGLLRDVTTTTQMFRQLVNELTLLLTYEATKGLADEEIEIETPLERMTARQISGKKVAVCPILRAGMGMLDAVLSLVPGARVGASRAASAGGELMPVLPDGVGMARMMGARAGPRNLPFARSNHGGDGGDWRSASRRFLRDLRETFVTFVSHALAERRAPSA